MICSVLIPSRNRFDLLLRAIRSVIAASSGTDFEIVVRLHADDGASLERKCELEEFKIVHVITGRTYDGYPSLNRFCNELSLAADGDWHWHLNDDMTVLGEGWDKKLAEISGEVLVQPEIHQLNTTIYSGNADGPAPIWPKHALLKCGIFPLPTGGPDTSIYEGLVTKAGWPVQFLPGIGVWHDWHGH